MQRFILALLFSVVSIAGLLGQSISDISGDWEGELKLPGASLKINLTISGSDSEPAIAVSVPQQGIKGDAADEISFEDGELTFSIPTVPGDAGWAGKFKPTTDDTALDSLIGTFTQGGQELDLDFARPSGPLVGPALQENLAKLEEYATDLLEDMNVPGAGIALVHKDKVLKSFGVGKADLESDRDVTDQTVFAIGSSSKAFTAFGLGLLVDRGDLDWDTPVVDYMADFRLQDDFATREMTAVDLLTHRSGLPRHDLLWYVNTDMSRQDLYQRLRHLEPTKSFRTTFQYQNLMYMTAGMLCEKISGQSWEDFTREQIFKPLGMSSANFDITSLPGLRDFAYGYKENEEDELERMDYHPLLAIGPAGSINANVADMAKWVSLHLNSGKVGDRQIIEEGTLKELHTPKMTLSSLGSGSTSHMQYALGWFTYDWNGNYIIEHGGNIDGFSALVWMVPEEELGVVVLTNKNGTSYGNSLSKYATDLFTEADVQSYYDALNDDSAEDEDEEEEDEEEEEEPTFGDTKPHHALSDYAGTYTDPGYGDIIVRLDDEQLAFQYGSIGGTAAHKHFETFTAKIEQPETNIDITFLTGSNGRVRSLEVDMEASLGHPITFAKQGDERMKDEAYLDKLAGKYDLEGQTLTIKRKRDFITLDVPGQPTYELEADADNIFKLTVASGYTVEFHFEGEAVTALTLHQPNGDFKATRKTD
ncbi:MAG: serine hydrolase [Bacteroidota bacterium]